MIRKLQGRGRAITALVTPFKNGEVDYGRFSELVDWQIEQRIGGLIPGGTTGEGATLSREEHLGIIRRCVEVANGRVPVIAGTGTSDTRSTISCTAAAEVLGADAALIVTPFYNRPSQEGLFRHFEAVASHTNIPIILYNVPARTGVDLSLETIARLSGLPRVTGIKDATGDMTRPAALRARLPEQFSQWSGHDATALEFNMSGGDGTMSVVSNVEARRMVEMHEALSSGNAALASAIARQLEPLIAALERETNPVPIKYALHLARGISDEVRLPLWGVQEDTADAIQAALLALNRVRTHSDPQRVGNEVGEASSAA
ncbi:4-hydroxy-tetrahydrodipicolinate synthase [Devosia sp. 1635]|uniref:4-hydroxy-tetrahydrodipicolinate synthase n=1 Tax=Devosia sp. 1635 TaxID=2726066 RepID=UPI0015658E54|nr:4-hydroxy-tetrahydrodipicolinate synthase [Devosia sp. 1635]